MKVLKEIAKFFLPFVKQVIIVIAKVLFIFGNKFRVVVISKEQITNDILERIHQNIRYYIYSNHKEVELIVRFKTGYREIFSYPPILIMDESLESGAIVKHLINNYFLINPKFNPSDAWEWSKISAKYNSVKIDLNDSRKRFMNYLEDLKKLDLKKVYVLGTGPSLEQAYENNWDDGYRIVCNTIVRDKDLWRKLNPNFIVAADGLYHFSNEKFAIHFRQDLYNRLKETRTLFLYPELFHSILNKEAPELQEKFIPLKMGGRTDFCYGLDSFFELPMLGNVLNLMLLPLACTLSKNVFMWGFDGRAPNDKFFWSNSNKHSYPEYFEELRTNHPAFFGHFVPSSDPNKYIKAVHGDSLERNLSYAESLGWKFTMMHKSWTQALQIRFK